MRALIPALVLLAGVGLAVMLRATPPAATEQAAVATRLEAVLPILEDLGVERWFADPSCRALEHGAGEGFSDPPGKGCGPAQAFTAPAAADWERVAGVLGGAVPGGRVRQVLRSVAHTSAATGAGATRVSITFLVAPQVLLGFDAPVDTWTWVWHEDPQPQAAGTLSPHWTFHAYPRDNG
jgi:hypothetical protein